MEACDFEVGRHLEGPVVVELRSRVAQKGFGNDSDDWACVAGFPAPTTAGVQPVAP